MNPKKLTMLLYLAADNNLSEESVWALSELKDISATDGVNLVALFDSNTGRVDTKIYNFSEPVTDPQFSQNTSEDKRKYANMEKNAKKFSVKAATGMPGFGSGTTEVKTASDPQVLGGFLEKILNDENHQAEKYILILGGHGNGVMGNFLPGDYPDASMTIAELRDTLDSIHDMFLGEKKIDILGMDSCLMSMVEIGYELRNAVQYLIGAEGYEPATGWPYGKIGEALKELIVNFAPTGGFPDSIKLARTIAEAHTIYYSDYIVAGVSIDQGVCDLSKIENLATELKNLANKLIAKITEPAIQNAVLMAHWKAQSYHSEEYTDLWDFCDLLQIACQGQDTEIPGLCDDVKKSIEAVVLYHNYYGPAFQHSHGLSIFFPWKETFVDAERKVSDLDEYSKLPFATATDWGLFLKRYVDTTQREMRGQTSKKEVKQELEGKVAPITVIPAPSPLVIPVRSNPPGSPKSNPPGSPKSNPPGSPKGLSSLRASMKNPPISFLVKKDTYEPVEITDNPKETQA